jgi:hypothetical protein
MLLCYVAGGARFVGTGFSGKQQLTHNIKKGARGKQIISVKSGARFRVSTVQDSGGSLYL